MKEEEKRLKEEKDVSYFSFFFFLFFDSYVLSILFYIQNEPFDCSVLLQRLKAEKAEITRFLQKSKIQQAPKVSRFTNLTRKLMDVTFELWSPSKSVQFHKMYFL